MLAVVLTASAVTAPLPSAHADPGKPGTPSAPGSGPATPSPSPTTGSGNPGTSSGSGQPAGAPRHGNVTLVTGDTVTVRPGPADRPPHAEIKPGKGREVSFTQRWRDGHLHVIPSDALPLIGRGLLDPRLFNVTQLLAWGYGDDRRDDIPVISQALPGKATPRLTAAEGAKSFTGLGLTASRLPKTQTDRTWASLAAGPATAKTLAGGVTKLWLDGKREPVLDRSVPQIGAPTAWAQGLTGEGVTVAVLDTGYDPTHPDLRDAVVQARNFDPDSTDAVDRNGHGTHVASTIAGSGQASGGRHKGAAPGAKLAVGKVGDYFLSDSAILAGMTWAATEVRAKVVNMSLGGYDGPEIDPLEHAVNTLSAQHGTLFVVAAGNEGPQSVGSPGSADAALTVGAVDSGDRLAGFSSTGPRSWDKAVKPDITAPGVGITAAAAAGTAPGPYIAYQGTSMAAPHVAGAAAILAQRHPTWTAEQLKATLIGSAEPTTGTGVFAQGAGRADVARAIAQPVTTSPGTLSATLPWPHTEPATKTVAYHNTGTTPLTLDLTLEAPGEAPPQGLITLPARQVTVPAGGQAPVTLTLNPTGIPTGAYAALLVARSGQTTVRTPIGAHVEPESHDQVFEAVGQDGGPGEAEVTIYDLNSDTRMTAYTDASGRLTVRLPVGEWNVLGVIRGASDRRFTFTHLPLRVTRGGPPLVLDARPGKRVTFSVDEPTAVPRGRVAVSFVDRQNGRSWEAYYGIGNDRPGGGAYVVPTRRPGLGFSARTMFHKQGVTPSPYRYDLVQYHRAGLPENPVLAARTAELAKVSATYRSDTPAGGTGEIAMYALAPHETVAFPLDGAVPLPGTVTHYRTPGNGITWSSSLIRRPSWQVVSDSWRTLERKDYTETWNNAVFGPAPRTGESARTGDALRYTADSLFSDGTPGRTSEDAGVTGTITLSKDGQTLGRTEFTECWAGLPENPCALNAQLPAGSGRYTLTTSALRDPSVGALSTKLETAWTFTSAHTTTATPLPLTSVRQTPHGLDTANRARHGTLTPITLRAERAPGAPAAKTTSLRMEASTDDGTTWRPVLVIPAVGGWTAFVPNPTAGDFVSLRTVAVDTAGNTATQTVTRAYALTP
ncbi:S8 family serine peptidase [Rhizohabitans arisaemae]|uniref:S8 family serine peptidase n=1 Tax=Rhizohabitans arisaemae TaxID=2720610 RepID=UPI0024B142D1|nr:S8 family serine peptidase [Rhizohabitans arisaemae]